MWFSLVVSLIAYVCFSTTVQSQEAKFPFVAGADDVVSGLRGDALVEALAARELTIEELIFFEGVGSSACQKLAKSEIDLENSSTSLETLSTIMYDVADPRVSAAHIAFIAKINWHILKVGTSLSRHKAKLAARATALQLSIEQFSNEEAKSIVETLRDELSNLQRLIFLLNKSNDSQYTFANLHSVRILNIYEKTSLCR